MAVLSEALAAANKLPGRRMGPPAKKAAPVRCAGHLTGAPHIYRHKGPSFLWRGVRLTSHKGGSMFCYGNGYGCFVKRTRRHFGC
jgi:hypothetical protein